MTALYISLLLQCLTGLAIIGAAFAAWQGTNMNKVASAKADLPAEKKNPGNPWLIAATLLTIAALVLGALGFGSTAYGTFKNAPAVAQTETPTTPIPGSQDFTSFCNPVMPAGKTFTAPEGGVRLPNGGEVTMGKAYVYRVVNWSLDCKSAEVYIFFTLSSSEYRVAGPSFDGSDNHDQQVWAFEGDKLESTLPKVTCDLARDTLSGGLGKDTSVNVHFSNQVNGQYTDVPEQCRP